VGAPARDGSVGRSGASPIGALGARPNHQTVAVGQCVQPVGVDRAPGDEGVGTGTADEEFGGEAAGAPRVDLYGVDEEYPSL